MEIRDPVHGSIHIEKEIEPIITHNFFQRLRGIKQLGLSEYVFPGGTHSRFIHSIGVYHIGKRVFDTLFKDKLWQGEFQKLRKCFTLSCLLHDIGHAPLSHATETVMPKLSELNIPPEFLSKEDQTSDRQATHEDYTIKAIADSSFSLTFKNIEEVYQLDRIKIVELIRGETNDSSFFTIDGINYFPILHQLVSSELDCDRMDYLLRDSYFCGVSYGNYDLDWLIDNLDRAIINDTAYLGINERAVVTFDDFLLSRYHMFVMVYFHYRSVCLEQILYKCFNSEDNTYFIPSDIEKYLEHDDNFLIKTLKANDNRYAKAIINNKIPEKIYESFTSDQLVELDKIQSFLDNEQIEYIRCSSKGRLSKYYDQEKKEFSSLKVVRKLYKKQHKLYFDINQSTDLFEKFSTAHEINRLHIWDETLTDNQTRDLLKLINS